jgi:hypothetical protein
MALAVAALAAVAGTVYGQPRPDTKPSVTEEPRPAPLSAQTQPARVMVKPTQAPPEVPTGDSADRAQLFSEILSGFVIVMFTVGGISMLAVCTRFYIKLIRPEDPAKLALRDPWVRANLERLSAPDSSDNHE